jgi:hypothetical protein
MSSIPSFGEHHLPGRRGMLEHERLPRLIAIAVCMAAALLGACGLTQGALFAAPSLLKYALTVIAPVTGLMLLTVREPLRLAVGLTIVCIPLAGAKATLAGEHVSLLTVMLALCVVVAIVSGATPRALTGVGAAGLAAVALLIGPLLIGSDSGGAVLIGAMVLVAWLVSRVAREGETAVSSIYWAVAAAAFGQALIAIYEFKTNHHLNLYGSAGSAPAETGYFGTSATHAGEVHSTHRPTGTLYDPISLGNVLAMSCPIIVILAVRTHALLPRLVLGGSGLVVMLGLALSFSRFSWIGAAVGTITACLALPHARQRVGALAAVAAVLVLAASLALATAGPSLISRFESISNPTEASNRITAQGDREREATWHDDVTIFLHHPLAGVGLGRIGRSLAQYLANVREGTNAQNTYLQLAVEGGLLGLAALLLVLGSSARALARGLHRSRSLAAGTLGAGVAILIVWLTDVTIRYTPVAAFFAIVIGLSSALAQMRSLQSPVSSGPE